MATLNPIESTELLPPAGDEFLGFRIFQLLGEILEDKSNLGLPDKWSRNYELSRNKHWKSGSKKVSLVSANLLYAHRLRTVNTLTDNNPTFNLSQQGDPEETDKAIYDTLLHTAEHWWNETEQQHILERSVTNGETYGCTVEKMVFNPDLEFGLGEVQTKVIDPYHFGFYPVKCDDIQDCEAVFHFWPMSVREVKRRWPDFAGDVRADDEILKELGDERREIQGGRPSPAKGYFSTFAGIVKNMLNISDDAKGDKNKTLIVEVWVKDETLDKDGGPLYPGFIRCIQTCSGGHVILSDRPNPSINSELPLDQAIKTYLYDKFPFTLTPSVTDTVNNWGMCDYEQLEGLQIEVDKTLSQITLWKDKASRLKIINPKDSGVSNDQFTNYPGIINPVSTMAAQGIRYMDPPKPPTDLTVVMDIYKDLFFLVSGTFDLEQAQTPGRDVIAYKAIAALIERASTMLKGKIRNYTKMIRERGRMYLSLVMNWYTEERWISYDDDGETAAAAIMGPDLIIPAKLTVVSGSTMPVSKVQQREEGIELYDKGAIDLVDLHRRLDTPGRKDLLKRMMQGPLGELIDKLEAIGVPPQMLEVFQELANMDEKEFYQKMKAEEIPPFEALLPQEGEGIDPLQDAELGAKQSDIQKTMAEIAKIQADIALIQEKINTEIVGQQVSLSGVEFDKEQLKIKRAELVAEMRNQQHTQQIEAIDTVSGLDAQDHQQNMDKQGAEVDEKDREYQHKTEQKQMSMDEKDREESRKMEQKKIGMAEKGQQDKHKIEKKKVDVAEKGITAKAKSKGTAPFRDRGTKSDNKRI